MLRRIDGVITLAVPLEVESNVLGENISVTIGGHKGTIGLPLLPASGIPLTGEVTFLQAPSLGVRPLPDLTIRGMGAGRLGICRFIPGAYIHLRSSDPDTHR